MEKVEKVLEKVSTAMGLIGTRVTDISVKESTVFVRFIDGYNNVYSKYVFVGDRGNYISVHDGKVVVFIEPVSPGYTVCQLIEYSRYFLARPLPTKIVVDNTEYSIKYVKDIWGW